MIAYFCLWFEVLAYVSSLFDSASMLVFSLAPLIDACLFHGISINSKRLIRQYAMQLSDSSLDHSLDTLSCTATFCSTRMPGAWRSSSGHVQQEPRATPILANVTMLRTQCPWKEHSKPVHILYWCINVYVSDHSPDRMNPSPKPCVFALCILYLTVWLPCL